MLGTITQRRPEGWVEDTDLNASVWNASDASVIKHVIKYLQAGQMRPEDASEWVAKRARRELRLLGAARQVAGAGGPKSGDGDSFERTTQKLESTTAAICAGGPRHVGVDQVASILQEANRERERQAQVREEQLRDGEFLCAATWGGSDG